MCKFSREQEPEQNGKVPVQFVHRRAKQGFGAMWHVDQDGCGIREWKEQNLHMCCCGLAEHDAEWLEPGIQQCANRFAAVPVSIALYACQHDSHTMGNLEGSPPHGGPVLSWGVHNCKQGREEHLGDLHA